MHWTLGILRHFGVFFGFGFSLLPSIVHVRPSASNATVNLRVELPDVKSFDLYLHIDRPAKRH